MRFSVRVSKYPHAYSCSYSRAGLTNAAKHAPGVARAPNVPGASRGREDFCLAAFSLGYSSSSLKICSASFLVS